jgi:acyl carrier protein
VVDRHLRPVPRGVPGELLLGGVGLARGYLGRPGLTAERFVPDPFAEETGNGAGGRLYRTGDLARWLEGGELQFLGRLDHQVKLRGFRIELGEVETALESHPDLREVVAVVAGEGAERRLVAYYARNEAPAEGGEGPGVAALRSFLGRRLPGYMVPDVFVELEALPRTPNGKVDRKALPEPPGGREGVEGEYVPPETEVERMLAAMWCEVLGVERVGIHDSFFELGGHSLSAHQILVRVRETFGVDVPIPRLFEQPTIAGLAVAIAEALVEGLGEEAVAEVLGSLE